MWGHGPPTRNAAQSTRDTDNNFIRHDADAEAEVEAEAVCPCSLSISLAPVIVINVNAVQAARLFSIECPLSWNGITNKTT